MAYPPNSYGPTYEPPLGMAPMGPTMVSPMHHSHPHIMQPGLAYGPNFGFGMGGGPMMMPSPHAHFMHLNSLPGRFGRDVLGREFAGPGGAGHSKPYQPPDPSVLRPMPQGLPIVARPPREGLDAYGRPIPRPPPEGFDGWGRPIPTQTPPA